ncbi:major facilitator superfamily domain-containing protein [Bombardia bombarda]|uniref:Major facilitator superfamily domain-containing protein n=1 Tax=Bombardia bombarda TaxID=252184 RepID=A0AA39WBJ7_9PEZI|nr:major facilitator superfamily domain-containing protein [Bombardia bombarda]
MSSKFNILWLRPEAPTVSTEDIGEKTSNDKDAAVHDTAADVSDSDAISEDAQAGVRDIEAMTLVWTKQHLYGAYIAIWFIYFVDAMQQSMSNSLLPFVTSSFYSHSLTPVVGILSSLIGGLFKLPLAKIIDIWGRPQGFCLMLFCLVIGLITMAACDGVKSYAAGQVFYWVGYNGLTYVMGVFIADTSSLRNRSLMFAFASSPYLITTWIGGPIATGFLNGPGWRWGYGAFSIITPFICSPLIWLFYVNYRKAHEAGLIPKRESNRTFAQSLKYYAIEFDIFGVLLIATGLALFLLAFSIYSYQTLLWKAPIIICFLIIGGLLCIAFVFWEMYAPKTFIPYKLLVDRTVLGACLLAAIIFVSFYIWDGYFYSFLLVVNGLTVTEASYVSYTYTMGSCLFSFVVGYFVRLTGRFRWIALWFGVPLTALGIGLMINFRQPDVNIGYIVMCQVFIAVAGGALVITEQMAVMAATTHQNIAVVLAIEAMFSSVGGAIGSTVASAIWTSTFPQRLAVNLPAESLADLPNIYASITEQLAYPVGSPTRHAIAQSYGESQRYMLIAATALHVLSFASVWMWKDIDVNKRKQVKGMVI